MGDASADAIIFREFDNMPAEHAGEFARACAKVAEPAVRARLAPEVKKRASLPDAHASMAAAKCEFAWDPESAIFRFLDALASANVMAREIARRELNADKRVITTTLLRRALARETRPYVKDALRALVDSRPKGH